MLFFQFFVIVKANIGHMTILYISFFISRTFRNFCWKRIFYSTSRKCFWDSRSDLATQIFKTLIEYSTHEHALFSKFRQIRSLLSYNYFFVSCDALIYTQRFLWLWGLFFICITCIEMRRKNSTRQKRSLVEVWKKYFLTVEIDSWICQLMISLNRTQIAFSCRIIIFTCRVML